jgi:ATP-binding cassette subfamily G (WHITE) protein 2
MASVAPSSSSTVSLVWKDLTYQVKLKKGEKKTILDNVAGYVQGGRLVAMMGPSGSGKSTLLDVLSDRVAEKDGVSGTVLVNGKPVTPGLMKAIAGYVPQDEYLVAAMTVSENLMFSAELRLGKHVPHQDKVARVEEVIKELNLEKVANSKVGDGSFIRGISGGERKRTSIGMELVTTPSVLFLDEPTSGLDSSAATSVMFLLKSLARSGKTIICSIHQPKYAIWQQLDELVLLSNGQTAYSGPANPKDGNDNQGPLAFFEKIGFHCDNFNSPPDFVLDVITEDEARQRRRKLIAMGQDPDDPHATTIASGSKRKSLAKSASNGASNGDAATGLSTAIEMGPMRAATSATEHVLPGTVCSIESNNLIPIPELFLTTEPYHKDLMDKIAVYEKGGAELPPAPQRLKPGFLFELWIVMKRQILSIFRNPRTWIIQVASNIVLGVIFGILFFQQDLSQESVLNRNGIAFFTIQFLVFSNMGAVELFLVDRRIFYHVSLSRGMLRMVF